LSIEDQKIKELEMLVSKQQKLIDALPSWLDIIAVIGILAAMLIGLVWVFRTLEAKKQGFGPNSLKALGIVLFIPSLVLLALLTEFATETLAALLGTVAGYVLSNTEDNSPKT
jgi:hypothetical protein